MADTLHGPMGEWTARIMVDEHGLELVSLSSQLRTVEPLYSGHVLTTGFGVLVLEVK